MPGGNNGGNSVSGQPVIKGWSVGRPGRDEDGGRPEKEREKREEEEAATDWVQFRVQPTFRR